MEFALGRAVAAGWQHCWRQATPAQRGQTSRDAWRLSSRSLVPPEWAITHDFEDLNLLKDTLKQMSLREKPDRPG